MNKKMLIIVMIGIAFVSILAGIVSLQDPVEATSYVREAKLNLNNQPTLGSSEAPVEVVVFIDFKCIPCKTFHEEVFPDLKTDYINKGKVKFTYVHAMEIGPDSEMLSRIAELIYARKPQAYWDYVSLMFKHQGDPQNIWGTSDKIYTLISKELSAVDPELIRNDQYETNVTVQLSMDQKLITQAGVTGLPSGLINGKPIVDIFNKNSIEREIDIALDSVQK